MRVRLIICEDPFQTQLVNADTNEPIQGVVKAELKVTPDKSQLVLYFDMFDVEGVFQDHLNNILFGEGGLMSPDEVATMIKLMRRFLHRLGPRRT